MQAQYLRNLLSLKYLTQIAVLALLYFITGRLGLRIDAVSGFATLVWPPSGIALAALMLFGLRLWPGIFLGAFLTYFSVGATPLVALGIGLGNTLEALAGATFLKLVGFDPLLGRLRHVLGLIFLAAFISTLISATIGVTSLLVGGTVPLLTYFSTWIAWWVGNALGVLVLAPFIMVWGGVLSKYKEIKFKLKKIIEGLFLFFLFIAINFWMYQQIDTPLIYLIFIPIIWAALSFQQPGATLATLATAIIAIWGTVNYLGPFMGVTLSERLFLLQIFIGVVSTTSLFLAVAVAEKLQIIKELKKQSQRIEAAKAQIEGIWAKEQAILESIGDGVIAINVEEKIMFMNQAAEKMLDRTFTEMISKNIVEVLGMEDEKGESIPHEEQACYRALKVATTTITNYHFRRKDKTRFPAHVIATPIILNDQVTGAVIVFQDITKEKELEQLRLDFLSLVSHQLRSPLSTMSWYTEKLLAEDSGAISKDQKKYLNEIYQINHRMIDLVNALLNISRVESGTLLVEREPVHIERVAQTIIRELTPLIQEKGLKVVEDYDKTAPPIMADSKIIFILVNNLISNAVKYTPPKGTVDIKVKKRKKDILIQVSDTGYGIPEAQQSQIFSKFFRADNIRGKAAEGVGLGLYMVKSILEKLGGKIWFESKEDKGSTFYITLPQYGMRGLRGTKQLILSGSDL